MQGESPHFQVKSLPPENTYRVFALLSMAFALFYTAIRAHLLSMTHDESLSYLFFARLPKSFMEVLTYKIPTSNNHLLNSLLMRVTTHFFGDSEFAIRMPNLLGHALFLIGIYKILTRFLRGPHLIIGIWLIIFQPFPLDYFTCARGYGLGLGFSSIGLSLLLGAWFEPYGLKKTVWAFLSLFALSFAAFANLAFLNLLMPILCLMAMHEIWKMVCLSETPFQKIRNSLTYLFWSVGPNMGMLYLVYAKPILKLRQAKEFYYGGNEGFWKDVLGSLITSFLYGRTYFPGVQLVISVLVILILGASGFVIFRIFQKKQSIRLTESLLVLIFSILLLTGLAIYSEHILLGVLFPHDRAVIYLIPLFLMLLLLLKTNLDIMEKQPLRHLFTVLINGIITLVILHSVSCLNFTHFYANKPDAHTKDAVLTMAKLTEGKHLPQGSLRIGLHWWFEPAVNLYLIKNNLKQFALVTRNGFDGPYDFYYVREEDKGIIEKLNLKILKHYDVYSAYLAVPQSSPFLDIEGSTS